MLRDLTRGLLHLLYPAVCHACAGPVPGDVPAYVETERPAAEEREVERTTALLRAAARPLLLADDGVLHASAWDELAELAERLGAPVLTTIQGKSSLPEDHPCSLGDMNSPAGQAAYPLADVVFAVGSRFAQTDVRWPWFTPPPRLIHLDADPTEIGCLYPPEIGLVGDTRTVLRQFLACLESAAKLAADPSGHQVLRSGTREAGVGHQRRGAGGGAGVHRYSHARGHRAAGAANT